MKLLTGILVFLSAFILGYSLADYTKLPSRLYVIEGQDMHIQWRKGGKEGKITLKKLPAQFLYFSKEKPKDVLKSISREEFLKNWQEIKTMSQEAFFLSLEIPLPTPRHEHALVEDLFYKEDEKSLMLTVVIPPVEGEEENLHTQNVREEHFSYATLHLFQMP